MAATTSKKVVVHRFDRPSLAGFFDPQSGVQANHLELLRPDGTLLKVSIEDTKLVCFVRDFDGAPPSQEMRIFRHRPKSEGLWLRLQFRDNDYLEGVLPNNLLQLDPSGFTIVPPDASANNQRIFVPRSALKSCVVLGVVGSAVAPKRKKMDAEAQPGLFDAG